MEANKDKLINNYDFINKNGNKVKKKISLNDFITMSKKGYEISILSSCYKECSYPYVVINDVGLPDITDYGLEKYKSVLKSKVIKIQEYSKNSCAIIIDTTCNDAILINDLLLWSNNFSKSSEYSKIFIGLM